MADVKRTDSYAVDDKCEVVEARCSDVRMIRSMRVGMAQFPGEDAKKSIVLEINDEVYLFLGADIVAPRRIADAIYECCLRLSK